MNKDILLKKTNDLIQKLKEIDDNFKAIDYYDGFKELYGLEVTKDEYSDIRKFLEEIDKEKLQLSMQNINKVLVNYIDDIKINYDFYNENYKIYLENIINQLCDKIEKIIIKNTKGLLILQYLDIHILHNYRKFINIKIDSNDIMEIFSTTNNNYVLFGKNGAGKTKLLNYVKTNYFKTNSFIIPSNRSIELGKLNNITYDYSYKITLSNIFEVRDFNGFPNDYLSIMLKDKDYYELKDNEDFNKDSTMKKFTNIFNSLSLNRKVVLGKDTKIMLYNENIEEYYAKDASDGEKSIIQFILFILFCPKYSFVFIDEPETHLNSALLCELFSTLERERQDIIFIYCTHNIDFIETRENAQLVFIEKYDGKNWKFEMMDSYENIPFKILIDIIGTKKDILFIEGDSNSLDYRLYSTLFPKFKIMSVGSCEKVIENCKSINLLKRNFYGIVDNDFRIKEEIKKLNENNIEVLKFNEIENMLLSSEIVEYLSKNYIKADNKIDLLKQNIIEKAKKDKKGIIQDYINKIYPKIQKSGHISYTNLEKVKSGIETINSDNNDKFIKMLTEFVEELDKILDNNDYDKLIMNLPNKGFISCITCMEITKERYMNILLSAIKENNIFRTKIIKNYFNILKDYK